MTHNLSPQEKRGNRWNPIRVLAIAAAIGLAVVLFSKPGPHALLKEPAPLLALQDLDGNERSLAQDIGKRIVVLDFFATWCPPCRESLPAYESVYQDYKDKGVAVYLVNLSEDETLVRRFLEEHGITIPVLMDPYREASEAYQVSTIPMSVVIGLDGVIEKVEQGYYGGSERALRRTLDRLLERPTS